MPRRRSDASRSPSFPRLPLAGGKIAARRLSLDLRSTRFPPILPTSGKLGHPTKGRVARRALALSFRSAPIRLAPGKRAPFVARATTRGTYLPPCDRMTRQMPAPRTDRVTFRCPLMPSISPGVRQKGAARLARRPLRMLSFHPMQVSQEKNHDEHLYEVATISIKLHGVASCGSRDLQRLSTTVIT